MHDKCIVYMSLAYSVWFICLWSAVYTTVFCESAWSVTRGRWCWMLLRGCSHTLSSPGIAREHLSTWTKEQRSWFPFFFFRMLTSFMSGAFRTLWRAVLHCRETPHFFMSLSRSKISNYRPASVCFFVIVNKRDKLPMINNIALTSTPMLLLGSAAKFNSISCVCKDFGCFSPHSSLVINNI